MKSFFELTYDHQWLLFFFHSKKEVLFTKKYDSKNKKEPLWNFDEYFDEFCNATKREMSFDDFDNKMLKLSNLTNEFINNGILVSSEKIALLEERTIKMTGKGRAYFELEIKNNIIDVIPNIDFEDAWISRVEQNDEIGAKGLEKIKLIKGTLYKIKNIIINLQTLVSLTSFSQIVIDNPDLTKIVIQFVEFLIEMSSKLQ